MSHNGLSQFGGHSRQDLNSQYSSPSVIATTSTPLSSEPTPHFYQRSPSGEPLQRGRRSSNLQPSSTATLPEFGSPNTLAPSDGPPISSPPSTGSTVTSQPIKLQNALKNLKRLKNQSTASLVGDAQNQQDLTARNAGGSASTYTPPLRQTASSPMLSPPLSIPRIVHSPVPVAATLNGNDAGSTGLVIDLGTVETYGQDSTGTPAIKGGKERKETKEEKENRRAEKEKARADKKDRKQAREKKRAEKALMCGAKQEGSISINPSLAAPFHEDYALSQGPFRMESQERLLGARSVETKPPIDHANLPGAPLTPLPTLLPSSATILESPSHPTSKDKSHKRDKPAHAEPVGASAGRKTREHKSRASVPDSDQSKDRKLKVQKEHKLKISSTPAVPLTTLSATMHTAGSHSGLNNPSQRYQPDQTCSTTPQPHIVNIQQPVPSPPSHHPPHVSAPSQRLTYASPPSHHPPYASPSSNHARYASSDHSYSRVSMSYEPQHRPSLDLRPDLNPLAKPAAKESSYTYSPLAQNDLVTTAYSHDYDQNSARAVEKTKFAETEEESDGWCGWFCGGSSREYEKQYSEVKQGKKPKKHMDDGDDDDDVCVVM